MIKILFIDHEPEKLDSIKRYLNGSKLNILTALDFENAKITLDKNKFDLDVVVLDIRFNHEDEQDKQGIEFLSWLKKKYPNLPVIMISGDAGEKIELIVESIRQGAVDVIDWRPGKDALATLEKKIVSVAAETEDSTKNIINETKRAYNCFCKEYEIYADGRVTENLFDYENRSHGFADKKTMEKIEQQITKFLNNEKQTLKILDIGCGPGTWLRRIVDRFGISKGVKIECVGVDISETLLYLAKERFEKYSVKNGGNINMKFQWTDLTETLPFEDNEFDLTLCLYTVLNHIPANKIRTVVKEISRITNGVNITSVKPVGGLPTVYVCDIKDVINYKQSFDTLSFLHKSGDEWRVCSHLFKRKEIVGLFNNFGKVEECLGLGIFFPRFEFQTDWKTDDGIESYRTLKNEMEKMEMAHWSNPRWVDMANHIMTITRYD